MVFAAAASCSSECSSVTQMRSDGVGSALSEMPYSCGRYSAQCTKTPAEHASVATRSRCYSAAPLLLSASSSRSIRRIALALCCSFWMSSSP